MTTRTRGYRLDVLAKAPDPDVVVIGGGINGISVYRELALQGLRVVLAEAQDYCAGASGALSRMIHGGLRYMENGEFDLVREALRERDLLLRNAPHFVAPLATTVPVFEYLSGIGNAPLRFLGLSRKPGRRGAAVLKLGLTFYDIFTRKSRMVPTHRFAGKARTARDWPDLNPKVKCSATYYDAWITHPERLGLEMIRDLEATCPDAVAVNYLAAEGTDGDALLLRDRIGGREFRLRPKLVVNATGAWIDLTNRRVANLVDAPGAGALPRMIGGTKGSHLIVRNPRLLKALGDQMIYYENQEGRVCILFPYFGNVLIGSTDIKVDTPEGVHCETDERAYMLQSLRFVFPDIEITPDQILYTFSGVRPLTNAAAATTGQIPRDHHCRFVPEEAGLPFPVMCMIGGKWTTFRGFGEIAADQALGRLGGRRRVSTDTLAIGGGRDFPPAGPARERWIADLAAATGIGAHRARALAERYGSAARRLADDFVAAGDRPLATHPGYGTAEIRHLIRGEHVEALEDLICRRTSLAISGELSADLLDELLALLAGERGWTADRAADERARTLDRLAALHDVTEDMLRARNDTTRAASRARTEPASEHLA
ncbi:glycerol-3-phosphate dehydrogenase/oxidase [Tistrella mobilis]|uniref:glycerol-3-phosphate dehydrogenase/oxidase n=1 Tax=Tistrella mobilis TaxID=171437 RepID=UPI003555FC0B